jgi:hypothetical protein
MRGRSPLECTARGFRQLARHQFGAQGRRTIQISATPTTESPILGGDALSAIEASTDAAGKFAHQIVICNYSNLVAKN